MHCIKTKHLCSSHHSPKAYKNPKVINTCKKKFSVHTTENNNLVIQSHMNQLETGKELRRSTTSRNLTDRKEVYEDNINHLIIRHTWINEITFIPIQFSSVQFSCSVVPDSLRPHESQHAKPPCPSPTPRVHSNSRPLSWWCHPTISSCVVPFSSCPQSLPASEYFPMSQLFAWGGQSTGVSALASVLSKKYQGWFPSEWTGWMSLQSKRLSRVFSNTTVQKHQFLGAQPSSQSNSHMHTCPQEKP